MSRIDDAVHPEAFIYVEDKNAKIWLREILAAHPEGGDLLPRIKISPVGPANVVALMGELGAANRLPHKSLAVLDGDVAHSVGCLQLPGENAPERVVFQDLRDAGWPQLDARFGVGAGTLLGYLEDAMLEPDHHKWPILVGDRVLKSAQSVWETLATEWSRNCMPDATRDHIYTEIHNLLEA